MKDFLVKEENEFGDRIIPFEINIWDVGYLCLELEKY